MTMNGASTESAAEPLERGGANRDRRQTRRSYGLGEAGVEALHHPVEELGRGDGSQAERVSKIGLMRVHVNDRIPHHRSIGR